MGLALCTQCTTRASAVHSVHSVASGMCLEHVVIRVAVFGAGIVYVRIDNMIIFVEYDLLLILFYNTPAVHSMHASTTR